MSVQDFLVSAASAGLVAPLFILLDGKASDEIWELQMSSSSQRSYLESSKVSELSSESVPSELSEKINWLTRLSLT